MSEATTARIVLFGFDAAPGTPTDHLVALARALAAARVDVHVVLVGDAGDEGAIARLQDVAAVTIVDHRRTRGIGGVLAASGLPGLARRWKQAMVRIDRRRWASAPFVLVDERAQALIAPAGGPGPWASLGRTELPGRPAALRLHLDGGAAPAGALALDPTVLDHTERPGEEPRRWPVLLVPTAGAWTMPNHAIEIARHLRERWPAVPVRWVAEREDAWIARHDLAAAGLGAEVSLVAPGEAAGAPSRVVVLAGYGAVPAGPIDRAREMGIPVIGFGPQADPPVAPPFAIDRVRRSIDEELADPRWAEQADRTLAARAEARRDHAAAMIELQRALGLGDGSHLAGRAGAISP